MANTSNQDIFQILSENKTICVIGFSADGDKPAHRIPVYMQSAGYRIVGVNPSLVEKGQTSVGGIPIYSRLADVPLADRQFVNVFRRSDAIPDIVNEVLQVGDVKILWLQLGITNPEAEARAAAAGISVVSDRCLAIEHKRLL